MADRYWVGGTANWDGTAGSKWALTSGGTGGEAVPTAGDDVFFDSASGNVTVTVASTPALALNLSFATFTGTFAGSTAVTVSGNLTLDNTMAGYTNTAALTFNATSGTQVVTTDGVVIAAVVTQAGDGGTVQLFDNWTMGSTRTYTLTNGTLDLNGKTLSCGIFSSNNSNTRNITSGGGGITVTGSGASVWALNTVTNFTLTGNLTVTFNYSGSTGTRTIACGATAEANSVSLAITAGTDALAITGSSKGIDCTGHTGGALGSGTRTIYGGLITTSGMTTTDGTAVTTFAATSGTHSLTSAGITWGFPMTFNGVGGTWKLQDQINQAATRALLVTNGTIDLNGFKITGGLFTIDDTTSSGGGMRLAGHGGLASG